MVCQFMDKNSGDVPPLRGSKEKALCLLLALFSASSKTFSFSLSSSDPLYAPLAGGSSFSCLGGAHRRSSTTVSCLLPHSNPHKVRGGSFNRKARLWYDKKRWAFNTSPLVICGNGFSSFIRALPGFTHAHKVLLWSLRPSYVGPFGNPLLPI